MLRGLLITGWLLSTLLASGARPQSTVQPSADNGTQQAPGSIEGRVTNSQTGDGISGVSIRLIPVGRRPSSGLDQNTTSQSDGTFRVDSVAPGSYFIVATQSNFTASANGQQSRQYIQVGPGQAVNNVALQLNPMGTIRGVVLDDNSSPVSGARVEAFGTYNARGKTQLRRISATTTDEKGKYALKTQGAGRYYVAAEAEADEPEDKRQDRADTPEQPQLDLVRTFYPKSLDLESATPLDVSAGQDMPDVVIQLRHAEAFHIRGKIDGITLGASNRTPTISLGPRGALSADGVGVVMRPKNDGTFDFAKVLPGSYTLTLTGVDNSSASQSGQFSHARLLSRQDVDVGAADVNGIVLTVVPLMTLSGRVAVEGQENANVSGTRINLNPVGTGAIGGFQTAAVQSDGSFTFEHVAPGEYTVRLAGAPSGIYLKSVLYNHQDVTAAGMDLTQGGGGQIDVVLGTGTGEVDGAVTSGNVTGTSMMILAPETIAVDGSGVLLGNLQSNGSFVVSHAPPGRYFAFAVERWSPLWQNADFLRQMQNQGVSVDVPENGRVQVELTLTNADQVEAAAMPLGLSAQ